MAIIWNEDYATEVDSVDRQHQKLFEYINKLEDCIKKGTFEGEKINDILEFLATYVKVHFQHEEFCMAQRKCPVAEKNIKAHAAFLAFYNDLITEYYANPNVAFRESQIRRLQKAAEDWLINHICKIDITLRVQQTV